MLALKRIPYRGVLVDIESGEHHRVLAPIHPAHQLPTLVLDDGSALGESVAIIEWLDETHPDPPLLPRDPMARARVRELVQLINAGIHPLQNTMVRKAVSEDPEAQRSWCARWIERGLRAYEARIQDCAGRFSVGDQLSMADLYLVPQLRNADRHRADLSGCPRIRSIAEACLNTPEAQQTHPDQVRRAAPTGAA